MKNSTTRRVTGRIRRAAILLSISIALVGMTSCGGGKGGQGPDGDGQGLVLISFLQGSVDNLPLNALLEWRFSEPVNAATITSASHPDS